MIGYSILAYNIVLLSELVKVPENIVLQKNQSIKELTDKEVIDAIRNFGFPKSTMTEFGCLIPLCFHSFMIGDDYDNLDFTRNKNGPYVSTKWTKSANVLTCAHMCIQGNNSIMDIFVKDEQTDFYRELADHVEYQLARLPKVTLFFVHLPVMISKEDVLKSMRGFGGIPQKWGHDYFPTSWICQKLLS